MKTEKKREYYLVQRLKYSPVESYPEAQQVSGKAYNPFGYGRIGDYEADYMGSAEFEFGALHAAYGRLAESSEIQGLKADVHGREIEFRFTAEGGFDLDEWVAWLNAGAPGKENSRMVEHIKEPEQFTGKLSSMKVDIWWAINEDVMWAFADENQFDRLFGSLVSGGKVVLR